MEFAGFPTKTQHTPIPNLFISSLLPQIKDLAELKVTLHIFWALHRKKEYPRFVTYNELLSDKTLMPGLSLGEDEGENLLERGLEQAVDRGLLLSLELESDGRRHRLYFLNTEVDKQALEKIRTGEIGLGALPVAEPYHEEALPNIFALYEENVGVLSPLVADRLKEAETLYPASWIADAIKEAVNHNHRSWSYIEAILRRWTSEGKESGEARGHSEKDRDVQKYFRGRYGRLVKKHLP